MEKSVSPGFSRAENCRVFDLPRVLVHKAT